jgi:hypothetical protein
MVACKRGLGSGPLSFFLDIACFAFIGRLQEIAACCYSDDSRIYREGTMLQFQKVKS